MMSAVSPEIGHGHIHEPITMEDSIDNSRTTVEVGQTLPDANVDNMKILLDQQQQLQNWHRQVVKKIFELETVYLDESSFGNVVRGWDLDGRLGPIRPRGQVDDKERIFSNSSYSSWLERKNGDGASNGVSSKNNIQPKGSYKKSSKKRKSDADELYGGDDY